MRARSLVAAVATTAALAGGVALAAPAQADAQSSASLAKLATLAVKGRAPKTGYDRSRFGVAWTDDVTVADGHNGLAHGGHDGHTEQPTAGRVIGQASCSTAFAAG